MKELSIEEKAKRYDKAIELVNSKWHYKNQPCVIDVSEIFPELKESEDEKIRKQIISFLKEFEHDHYRSLDFSSWIAWLEKQSNKSQGKSALEAIKEEKVDNANKIEPKFKVGDWVVYNRNNHSRKVMQIYDIRDNRYYFNDNIHFSWSVKECDEKSHLWTIEDAKDGDVLCLGGVIAIFKKYISQEKCICYCSFCDNGGFEIPIENGEDNVYGCTDTIPATQEKRNLLFTKMKEAGYEWDADKKVLNKVIIYE